MAKRYYTEEAYEQIKNTIDTIQLTDVGGVKDFFGDLWSRIKHFLGFLKMSDYGADMQGWYNQILDSHDTTLSKIVEIFYAVENVDNRYSNKLDEQISLIMDARSGIVNNLRDVISGKTSLAEGRAIASATANYLDDMLPSKFESWWQAIAANFKTNIRLGKEYYKIIISTMTEQALKGLIVAVEIAGTVLVAASTILTRLPVLGDFGLGYVVDHIADYIATRNLREHLSQLSEDDILNSIEIEGYTVTETGEPDPNHPQADLTDYNRNVSDTELALLTNLAYTADDAEENRAEAYAHLVRKALEGTGSPLENVTADQVTYIHDFETGFAAFVISDGSSAVVVFPGTDLSFDNGFGVGDIIADTQAWAGIPSKQVEEAIALVEKVTSQHDSVAITGHSLGGYLATSATLHNEGVGRCVTFDPLGRYTDSSIDPRNDPSRSAVVTTHENKSSVISWNGHATGDRVEHDLNSRDPITDHSLDAMYDEMGGTEEIKNNWSSINNSCPAQPPAGKPDAANAQQIWHAPEPSSERPPVSSVISSAARQPFPPIAPHAALIDSIA